ncbi:hypothetical protein [Desulfitobacterium sp.]|uniref:hypothetical protein n=1 Tax=Desulfitobacterium sp. TaxID=49981 RepID=UPI002CC7577F|nr:hypothetical protein [Desulfitobacterium sp.]HVJ50749.1 hypothetical protein [Desulfitobacterium sp.]
MLEMEEQIEILRTADEYLDKLIKGTSEAAEYLYSGQENKGFQLVSLIADGIMWLIEVIEITSQVQKEEITTSDVMSKINEINEAIKIKDTVTVADLLEFEVVPILEQWQLSIQKLLG